VEICENQKIINYVAKNRNNYQNYLELRVRMVEETQIT
jgi:hypothetical protein